MASRIRTRQKPPNIIVTEDHLPATDLPTVKDVLAKMKLEKERNNIEIKHVAERVLPEIKSIYSKVNSNLVLNNDRTILAKLTTDFKQMKDLERSKAKGKKKENFELKIGKLFDIILYKCKIVSCHDFSDCDGCQLQAHCLCECDAEDKIPQVELLYVLDQRCREGGSKGKFQIGSKDKKEIENMEEAANEAMENDENQKKIDDAVEEAKKKEAQRLHDERVLRNEELTDALAEIGAVCDSEDEDDVIDDDSNDGDFNANTGKSDQNFQNRMGLRNLAMICDRHGVSSRAGAAIANAALIDAKVISACDQTQVIDKNKLRRAIEKFREERVVEDSQELVKAQGQAYYCDGKKDITLFVRKDDHWKTYNTFEEEEHISVSSEPGGKYVTHLTPSGGKGSEIAEVLVGYLTEHGVIDSWKIIGGDSTAVDRGCFVLIERTLGRRLFRVFPSFLKKLLMT